MLSKLKKLLNRSSPTDIDISETSKVTLRKWQKIVRNKHKNEDYKGDELFQDPLLLIEWDNAGIQARTAVNAQFTKETLITLIRSQPGYIPIPTVATQPDCAFTFISRPALSATISALNHNNWSNHVNGVADVGQAYSVLVPRKGQLDIAEEPVVFQ